MEQFGGDQNVAIQIAVVGGRKEKTRLVDHEVTIWERIDICADCKYK